MSAKIIAVIGGRILPMLLVLGFVSALHAYPAIATPDGYAKGTTGGAGGTVKEVASGADFKSACASSDKMIIVVTKDLGSVGSIPCKGNKTIVGTSASSGFNGNLTFSSVSNIIVQNLRITNPSGVGTADGIEAVMTTKMFVTHVHFVDTKDGAFDIKRGSDNVTVTWCRFSYAGISGHNFPNLIGHSDDNASQDKGKLHITMHHNWYDKGCESRMPRVRFGTVHVFNNFYLQAKTYAVGTGVYSTIRLENSVFENIAKPWNDMGGMAKEAKIGWNNLSMTNGTKTPTYAPNSWSVFTPPYDFKLESLADVKNIVTDASSGAGNTFGSTTAVERGAGNGDLGIDVNSGFLQARGAQDGDRLVVRNLMGNLVAEFGAEGGMLPASANGVLLVQLHSESGRMTQKRITIAR